MDCFAKVIILQRPNGRKIIFKGKRKVVSNYLISAITEVVSNYLISAITANKMMKKGCEAYLAFVMDSRRRIGELTNFPII
jgi:hypothetical protein